MRFLAAILLAMLTVSVFVMPLQAYALDPITFTTEDTVTSASTSTFQQLYENGTNSLIFLDSSNAGQSQLDTYVVGTSTVTTDSVTMTDGANTVNSAAYLSPVDSTSTLVTYSVGRDSVTGANVYGAININSSFAKINATSQTTGFIPLGITQSQTNIYSPLASNTAVNGDLRQGSLTRAYGSYSEAAVLYSGAAPTPGYGLYSYDVTNTGTNTAISSTNPTTVGQRIETGSSLIGAKVNGIVMYLGKSNAPTGTATIGVYNTAGTLVHTFGTQNVASLTTSPVAYVFISPTYYTFALDDRVGIRYTGGDPSNRVLAYGDNTNPVSNTVAQTWNGAAWSNTVIDNAGRFFLFNAKSVVYEGSPDTTYTFFESGANTIRTVKYTSSATTLGTTMGHTTGAGFQVVQMSGKVIIQTATKVYELNTSTDAITELEATPFLSAYPQSFAISPSARTYISALYSADSDEALLYNPSAGTSATGSLLIDSASAPTLGTYDPAKYYYLQTNQLTIEGATAAATSWTIKSLGNRETITVTPYTETVGNSLMQNNTVLTIDVVTLSCDDGNYDVEYPGFAVGDDSDCNEWWTYDVNGAAVARHLPYAQAVEPVHANEYNYYTFNLSVADPVLYYLETSYDGKNVDTGNFDSGGQLQQRLLYQQCYTINIEESLSGNQVMTGDICAGDELSKTISLSGIVIPDDWLGSLWSYTISRNYTSPSPSNNGLLFVIEKSTKPFDVSIYATDHPDPDEAAYSNWFNFTNVSGTAIANVTGVNSNQTIFFTAYEDNIAVLNAVSSATSFDYGDLFDDWGNLFGLPVAMLFPVLVALIFPKSQAYFGLIVAGASIAVMELLGFMTLGPGIWAVSMVMIALGVVMGYKRS